MKLIWFWSALWKWFFFCSKICLQFVFNIKFQFLASVFRIFRILSFTVLIPWFCLMFQYSPQTRYF